MTQTFEEQLTLIRELQEIDSTLYKHQTELNDLPNKIKMLEDAYLTVKTELDTAKTELAAVEKAKRNDEMELAASVEHHRNREAKLYAIKTNKEYQSALKEIADGKKANKEREDRILQAMEKIDELTKKITQLNLDYADKESVYTAKQIELTELENKIHAEMKKDEVRRPLVAAKIDKIIIRKYEFVKKHYANAAASVANGICQGCSTRIPPQLFNEMLRREEIKICPSCQRLIYVADAATQKEENETKVNAG